MSREYLLFNFCFLNITLKALIKSVAKADMLAWIQVLHHQNAHMGSILWRRAASPPLPPPPPPDFYPASQTVDRGWDPLNHDPLFPLPPPSLILPMLNEGRYCPFALERIRRGVKLREVKKQSCELDVNTARRMLLKQVRQGVKLKPVSSDINKSHLKNFAEIQAFMVRSDIEKCVCGPHELS